MKITVLVKADIDVRVIDFEWYQKQAGELGLAWQECHRCRKHLGDRRFAHARIEGDPFGPRNMRLCEDCGIIAERELTAAKTA